MDAGQAVCTVSVDQIIIIFFSCTSSDPEEENVVPNAQSSDEDVLVGRYIKQQPL